MISKKHKTFCNISSYTKHLLILASTVTECIYISAFASLVGIPAGIASSEVGLKIWN